MTKARLDKEFAVAEIRTRKHLAEAQLAALESEKRRLQNVPADPVVTAWCADLTEDLSGEVGTIEIPDERKGVPVILQPGFNDAGGWQKARDGQLQPAASAQAFNHYYNKSLLPAWQKWKPHWRLGVITAINAGDLCDVTLDTALSSEQDIDVNQGTSLVNVPIVYMNCNSAAFAVDDRVVVRFEGQDFTTPTVIGFESNPKPCVVDGSFIVHTMTYADPFGTINFANVSQIIDGTAGTWTADDTVTLDQFDEYWYSPDGKILGWDGWQTNYWYWLLPDPNLQHALGQSTDPAVQYQADYAQFLDYKDETETIWGTFNYGHTLAIAENGIRVADRSGPSGAFDFCYGAALIGDSPNQVLVTITFVSSITDRYRINVALYDPLNFPLQNSHFVTLAELDVTGWEMPNNDGSNDLTFRERQGPFQNYTGWRFSQDGRRAVVLLWNNLANPNEAIPGNYFRGSHFKVIASINGTGGAPSQGGNMVGFFDVEEVPPIRKLEQWNYDTREVLETMSHDLSFDRPTGPNGNLWPFRYIGDAAIASRYKTVATSGEHSEVVIAYDWDDNGRLITISYELEHITEETTTETSTGWRQVSLSDGQVIPAFPGYVAQTVNISNSIGSPIPNEDVPTSGTAIVHDAGGGFTDLKIRKKIEKFKRDGAVFYSNEYRSHDENDTWVYAGDQQLMIGNHGPGTPADPTGAEAFGTKTRTHRQEAAGLQYPWIYLSRADFNKKWMSFIEVAEQNWNYTGVIVSDPTDQPSTFTALTEDLGGNSAEQVKYKIVDTVTGGLIASLDLGSKPILPSWFYQGNPVSATANNDWFSNRWWEFGVNWQQDDVQPQVGDVEVIIDTRLTPNTPDLYGARDQAYPSSPVSTYMDNTISSRGWFFYRPHCDVALNNSIFLMVGEGIGDSANNAVIKQGGPNVDPRDLVDVLVPGIKNDATIRFNPVVPFTGVAFTWGFPTETPLDNDDGGAGLTDGNEAPITT